MYDLIIFDCDGTLVDSEYLNNKSVIDLLHKWGHTQFDLDYSYEHFMGKGLEDILAHVAQETGHPIPDDYAAQIIAINRAGMAEHLKPIDGALDVVSECAARFKICVGSNGERPLVLDFLGITGLDKHLPDTHVFTKEIVENAKPAPDLYLYVADKMGVAPERTLVIEDSVPGAMAGKAAGMTVVGFTGVAHDKDEAKKALEKVGVDVVFDKLIHILDYVDVPKTLVSCG